MRPRASSSAFRRVVSVSRRSVLGDGDDERSSLLRDAGGSGFSAVADPAGYGSVRFEAKPSGHYVFDNGDEESVASGDEERDGEGVGDESGAKVYKGWSEMWPICAGLWTAIFCSALSTTIVANLQLEIGSYFKAGALASWLGTAFLLGLAGVSPLCGRFSQIMGRKGALLLTLFLFLGGTIACAVAPSMYTILLARAVAGAGSGGLLTVSAIILSDLVSPADRGLYQGGASVLFGAGSAVGAVIGGAVAEEWDWRASFWVQVPPFVLATLIVWWNIDLPEPPNEKSVWKRLGEVDWAGSGLIMLSISCLTVASSLVTNVSYGPSHPLVHVLLAIALLSLPIFVWVEARAAEPILPLELLTQPQPALVFAAFFLLTATWFARMYMQPVYIQLVRGVDVLESGMLLIPFSIVSSGTSLYAGWHMRFFREYKWFTAVATTFAWIQAISIMVSWSPATSLRRITWELCISGLSGMSFTSLITALILCVPPDSTALAISTCYLFRAIGQVLGVSISAAIQQSILVSSLRARLSVIPGISDLEELIWEIVEEPTVVLPRLGGTNGHSPDDRWGKMVEMAAREGYMDGLRGVFGFVLVGGVLMTGVCIAIRPQPI